MPPQLCEGWLRRLEPKGLRGESAAHRPDCDRRHRCRHLGMIPLIDRRANQGERVISPAATWYVWLVTIDRMFEAVESVGGVKRKRLEKAEIVWDCKSKVRAKSWFFVELKNNSDMYSKLIRFWGNKKWNVPHYSFITELQRENRGITSPNVGLQKKLFVLFLNYMINQMIFLRQTCLFEFQFLSGPVLFCFSFQLSTASEWLIYKTQSHTKEIWQKSQKNKQILYMCIYFLADICLFWLINYVKLLH